MKNLYFLFVGQLKPFFFIFLFFTFFSTFGQQININETALEKIEEIDLKQKGKSGFLSEAKRAREFSINNKIKRPNELSVGQKINLDLFSDRKFPSVIHKKFQDINGVTTLVFKLENHDFAFGYLSLSKGSINLNVSIPELKEFYTTRYNQNRINHLIQLDNSIIEKSSGCDLPNRSNIKNSPLQDSPENSLQGHDSGFYDSSSPLYNYCANPDGENAISNIDVMVVYSDEALQWAQNNGGIDNAVATAMAKANTVYGNSELNINFNLVYSAPANYSDASGNSLEHLEALTFSNDGVMDDLHDVRKNVGADMVAIFTYNGNVGGMAYGLENKYGDPSSSFSLTRITAAVYGETFSHELGHNLGAMHSKYQNVQAGPYEWDNWPENTWSNGWRWMGDDNNMYCTVMSYSGGSFYEDGINAQSIPYFSNPDKIYQGQPMGDIADGDNFRTLNYTKFLVANYSSNLNYCSASGGDQELIGINEVALGNINHNSSVSSYSDFSSLTTCAYLGESQSFKISAPGSGTSKEVSIWIDWNNDNNFDENTERVYQSIESLSEYTGEFIVPSVEPGIKRVRIRVHDSSIGEVLTPCGDNSAGEVEDYSLNVIEPADCSLVVTPENLQIKNIQSNNLLVSWNEISGIKEFSLRFRILGDSTWQNIDRIFSNSYRLKGLDSYTEYEIQVASSCANSNLSEYSASISARTNPALDRLAFEDIIYDTEVGLSLNPISIKILNVNDLVSNSSATITLSLVDESQSGGILNGSLVKNAIAGIVEFDNLSIDQPGIYSIQASMEGLPGLNSNSFTITVPISKSFTVNTVEDTPDADIYDQQCADLNGNCSLRAALENANRSTVKDTVNFNIPGNGVHVINVLENLPFIEFPVIIDGSTQNGYSHQTPKIIIFGGQISVNSGNTYGMSLQSRSSTSVIRGLVIGGFGNENQNGIAIDVDSKNNIITSNYIGIAADGETPFPNRWGIVLGGGANGNNLIGGPNPEDRNIISGNARYGIEVGSTSFGNIIQGNYIGTNSTGTAAIPNDIGILARETNIYDGNLISGNNIGLDIWQNDNLVINNLIGTDYSGTNSIPNSFGIQIDGQNNIIGQPGSGNIIAGNTSVGIQVTSNNNVIVGNIIGAQKDGVSALGNVNLGIELQGNQNQIGGNLPGEANTIAFNGGSGITVYGLYNEIFQNKIFDNNFGIDLGNNGLTPNDRDDSDTGPNNYQNYPELSLANFEGNLMDVELKFSSDPSYSAYPILVNLYKSKGNRQGSNYIGEFYLYTSDLPKGNKTISKLVELITAHQLRSGDLIVATATDSNGNTSEFSDEIAVSGSGACTPEIFYADTDGDGLGDSGNTIEECSVPEGYVANSDDCDDTDPDIGVLQTWYRDADGDGFGDPSTSIEDCGAPTGYISDNTDCDDSNDLIYPGAIDDSIDGVDQDCDGTDGPVTSCSGADNLLVSEICSTATSVTWEITNSSSCQVEGRWELRKNSSTGDSAGTFSLTGEETIQFTSGVVDKGKTQIIVYWNDSNGNELNTNQNASGIDCTSGMSSLSEEATLMVAPNPVTEGIGMYFTAPTDYSILIAKVYNSSGRLMASESFEIEAGMDNLLWNIDHSSWIDGVYILNASINGQTYQTQFIK